jgi:hypothetical protein
MMLVTYPFDTMKTRLQIPFGELMCGPSDYARAHRAPIVEHCANRIHASISSGRIMSPFYDSFHNFVAPFHKAGSEPLPLPYVICARYLARLGFDMAEKRTEILESENPRSFALSVFALFFRAFSTSLTHAPSTVLRFSEAFVSTILQCTMCACLYAYMYACIHIYICICMYVYTYIHTDIHTHTHTHVHECTFFASLLGCRCMPVSAHLHERTCSCTYAKGMLGCTTHTHTHTYTHTYMHQPYAYF